MRIVASQSADFRRSQGKEVMEALIKRHEKEIDAVFAHNDDMAIGAIQALEEAGRKPGVDVIVVSIDGVKAAFEAIIEGKLSCTVECNPLLGPMAFDAVEQAVQGKTLPKKTTVTDRVFDSTNSKDLIGSRQY